MPRLDPAAASTALGETWSAARITYPSQIFRTRCPYGSYELASPTIWLWSPGRDYGIRRVSNVVTSHDRTRRREPLASPTTRGSGAGSNAPGRGRRKAHIFRRTRALPNKDAAGRPARFHGPIRPFCTEPGGRHGFRQTGCESPKTRRHAGPCDLWCSLALDRLSAGSVYDVPSSKHTRSSSSHLNRSAVASPETVSLLKSRESAVTPDASAPLRDGARNAT